MKTETDTHPRHITILISPTGEEFYEAYGPMTKDREKATLFFTNDKTLREPPRFGNSGDAFWNSERDSAAKARKEYRGWTFRHEPQTPTGYAVHACDGKGYLATQGREHWYQETPDGWAMFPTEDAARDILEAHHSSLGTETHQGGEIVTLYA